MGSLSRFGRQLLATAVIVGGVAVAQLGAALPAGALTADDCGVIGNLVTNCGFESGAVDGGWTGSGATVDGSDAHAGSDAANLNGASATLTQTVSGTELGKQYDLIVWFTGPDEDNSLSATVTDVQGGSVSRPLVVGNGGFHDPVPYTVATLQFTATSADPTVTFTYTNNDASTLPFSVDDVAVAPASCADIANNLVQNCGFETGDLTDWTLASTPSDAGVVGVGVHTGSYAMDFFDETDFDTLTQDLSGTHDGDTYEVSFWLLGSAFPPDEFNASIVNAQGGSSILVADVGPPGTGSYERFTGTFTAGSSDPTLEFGGWNFTGDFFLDDVSVVQTATTVTFDSQGGSAVASQSVDVGDTATQPTDPTRSGYTFEGWNTTPDGSGPNWNFSDPVDTDTTLYALWSPTKIACDLPGNLVQNCSFEDGTTDWTASAASNTGIDTAPVVLPHSGDHFYGFGATGGADATLSQLISGTSTGKVYELTFWLRNDSADPDFTAKVTGTQTGEVDVPSIPQTAMPYTQYDASFTAGSGAPTLEFAGHNAGGAYSLDDVQVRQMSPQTQPTSPAINVTSSANPASPGDGVTFTATLSPVPGCGSVTWLIDGAAPPAGTPTGGSGGTYTLGPISSLVVGNHPVTAVFTGCGSSGSGTVIEQIVQPGSTPPPPTGATNPTITATVKGKAPKQHSWWSTATVVSFNCTVGSAPLTNECPGPVTLTKSGADQSVTRSITATDGGAASVTVTLSIDRDAPVLHVKRHGQTLTCEGSDALSGLASCTIHRHKHTHHGVTTVHWTATATDEAGNTTTKKGHFTHAT